jgi:hypothetical protein
VSAARDLFHRAVLSKNDQEALKQLNGLSMQEMLTALAAIGQDHRNRISASVIGMMSQINAARVIYAIQVVNGMALPPFPPGDLNATGQVLIAQSFVALPSFKAVMSRTADEAAKAVLNAVNPASIMQNREYWGLILHTGRSFVATPPTRSADEFAATPVVPTIPGSTPVAIYHTHGAGFKFINGSTASESFSVEDRGLCVMKFYLDGYLATPSSNLLHLIKPPTRPAPTEFLAFGKVVPLH